MTEGDDTATGSGSDNNGHLHACHNTRIIHSYDRSDLEAKGVKHRSRYTALPVATLVVTFGKCYWHFKTTKTFNRFSSENRASLLHRLPECYG